MKKDKLLNSFTNNKMKPQSKKNTGIIFIKNQKGISPLDSGAMVKLKGGDTDSNSEPSVTSSSDPWKIVTTN